MTDPLRRTLAMLTPELVGMVDDWCIISGAAVALHGVPEVDIADVDLLVSRRDAEPLALRLGIALAPGETSDLFRSALFGRWLEPPLPVEIMAGFHVRSGDGWSEGRPTTREAVSVEGSAVFVPARDELGRMLLGFGRPKDRARAGLLRGAEGHKRSRQECSSDAVAGRASLTNLTRERGFRVRSERMLRSSCGRSGSTM